MIRLFFLSVTIFLLLTSSYATINADQTGVIWEELDPAKRPTARFHHAMVYDSHQEKILLFGGNAAGLIENITWQFDPVTTSWTDLNASNSPLGLNYHAMAYDSVNRKTILFGGVSGSPAEIQGETYAYDYETNNWTKMNPNTQPSARRSPNMVFDPVNARVVLFGGRAFLPEGGLGPAQETWTYDYQTNNWTQLELSTQPSGRTVPAMTYVEGHEVIVLYGGTTRYHSGFFG